jgi:hypothetical protein
MRHVLTALLVALMLPGAARSEVDPEEVLASAFASDVAAVETAFDTLDADIRAGSADPDALLRLFWMIGRSHPDLARFAEAWIEAKPTSPHARAVRAYQLYTRAVNLRGPEPDYRTAPEALAAYQDLVPEILRLVRESEALEPFYLPSVYLLLSLPGEKLSPFRSREATLSRAMEIWGSRRLLVTAGQDAQPYRGGRGFRQVEQLCEAHADRVRNADGYTEAVCIADLIWSNGFDLQLKMHTSHTVAQSDADFFRRFRYEVSLMPLTRDFAAIEALVTAPDFADLAVATQFELNPQVNVNGLRVWPTAWANASADARARLESDPERLSALDLFLDENLTDPADPHAAGYRPDLTDYALQRLRAAPYDPVSWAALARVRQSYDPAAPIDPVALWAAENAVGWSMHDPYYLETLRGVRASLLHNARSLAADGRLSPDQMEALQDAHLCPLMRADRVYRAICDVAPAGYCNLGSPFGWMVDEAVATAEAGDLCKWERFTPVRLLAYNRLPLDAMPPLAGSD